MFNARMTPEEFEFARLKECEAAWNAVFNLCHAQDPTFCDLHGKTGTQCILEHIRALGEQTKIARAVPAIVPHPYAAR